MARSGNKNRGEKHNRFKHGMVQTTEYKSWASMLARCKNPNNKSYANYGGRGIFVCKEWEDFSRFIADMGPRPEGMSLERIDNSKGYYAENCKWADKETQSRNRRNTVLSHEIIEQICEMKRQGKSYAWIASQVACSASHAFRAVKNQTWVTDRAAIEMSTKHRSTKLSAEQTGKTFALRRLGYSQERIAKLFGVSGATINRVLHMVDDPGLPSDVVLELPPELKKTRMRRK